MFIRTAPLSNVSEGILRRSYQEVQGSSAAEKVYEIHLDLWPTSMVVLQGTSNKAGGLKQQFRSKRGKFPMRSCSRYLERHLCEADGKAWSGASLTPYPAHDPDVLTGGSSRHLRSADRTQFILEPVLGKVKLWRC